MKRKIAIFLSLFLSLMCVLCLVSCGDEGNNGGGTNTGSGSVEESKLVCSLLESTPARVVISVTETDGKATVLDCMEYLKGREENFTYEIANGMITSINGVENPADFSRCWMIYTSDAEMANASWTTEYNGETLGSAIVGAETLDVIAGGIYVWDYVSF